MAASELYQHMNLEEEEKIPVSANLCNCGVFISPSDYTSCKSISPAANYSVVLHGS
jgi:hypothetical protein